MTEEKVKNRGWVKNAAIIFLSIMLVLTFFSNTIMNRSLPEVAAQYVSSGSITTQIRGNGTIEAVETYEVKSADSRKVQSVMVRAGQEVQTGDLLFVLAEGDSSELEQLKSSLADLQYQYQVKLINLGSSENGESREVTRAREKLEAAIAERDGSAITAEEIAAAKALYDTRKLAYDEAERKLAAAGGETSGGGSSGSYAPVQSAQDAMNAAKVAYDAALIQYKHEHDFIEALAKIAYRTKESITNENAAVSDAQMAPYAAAIVNVFGSTANKGMSANDYFVVKAADTLTERANLFIDGVDITVAGSTLKTALDNLPKGDSTALGDLAAGYEAVQNAKEGYDSAQASYNDAVNSYYDSFSPDNSALMRKRDEAQTAMNSAKEQYDAMCTQRDAHEAAKDLVIQCQDSLESLLIQEQLDDLELGRMGQQIAAVQKQIADLGAGGAGGEVRADVSGIVRTINVSAGNTCDPTTPMCTIEVPDRGYTVSMSVTTEQAQKVAVGDAAEISTGYWGGSGLQGRLVNVRTDPQNPQANKLLVFEVTGDAEPGQQVSITIGQRSQNYDVVVPNSAIRNDANGDFVLLVETKPSPLGNRYVATRADVKILASDDSYTAVAGGVSAWDYVVTTSTKPIESGMLVRLPDNN